MKLDFLYLIVPGLIAIIGNIIFYAFIKNRIDKSIEKHKISYAGVYQEKIKIHKEILSNLFEIKFKVQQYQYSANKTIEEELFLDFNKFIYYYIVNQPFLKQEILEELKNFTKELQSCFDNFYVHNSLFKTEGIEPSIRTEALKKFFESGNKLKQNGPFKQIEEVLINEMRKDLRIEE